MVNIINKINYSCVNSNYKNNLGSSTLVSGFIDKDYIVNIFLSGMNLIII
jgi:hypothetical protein